MHAVRALHLTYLLIIPNHIDLKIGSRCLRRVCPPSGSRAGTTLTGLGLLNSSKHTHLSNYNSSYNFFMRFSSSIIRQSKTIESPFLFVMYFPGFISEFLKVFVPLNIQILYKCCLFTRQSQTNNARASPPGDATNLQQNLAHKGLIFFLVSFLDTAQLRVGEVYFEEVMVSFSFFMKLSFPNITQSKTVESHLLSN